MPNLHQESLFSLELVVDKLSLSKGTICRFPSVAFRLLDFPTLVIHHVDLHLAEMLRAKINADPYYKLPAKFTDFQDVEGNFLVQKGKSCLFKVSPNTLQTHLSSAPLYVMIMDTYPDVPKLVGSCSVPLNEVMDELYEEICKQGVSMPLVNGEKGSFEIFNLMGLKLGSIDLSYRLLSLGGALLQHIPEKMVAQVKPQDSQTTQHTSEEFWRTTVGPDVASATATDHRQDKGTEMSHPMEKSLKDTKMQTDEVHFGNAAVQTMKRKSRTRIAWNPPPSENADEDDLVLIEAVCPPPLYYNSKADVSAAVSLFRKQQAWFQQRSSSDADEFSDDGTIRPEDKFSDIDEFELKQPSSQVLKQKKPLVQKTVSKLRDQPQVVSHIAQFPILQALMAEILQIQGLPTTFVSAAPAKTGNELRHPKFMRAASRKITIAKPERTGHTYATSQVGVTVTKTLKPQEKRDRARVSQQELVPGLTNTQRLRLLKHNPRLAKEAEAKEEERISKWKKLNEQKKHQSTAKQFVPEGKSHETRLELRDLSITHESDMDDTSMTTNEYHSHRRPVPTPRSTLIAAQKRLLYSNEQIDSALDLLISKGVNVPQRGNVEGNRAVELDLQMQKEGNRNKELEVKQSQIQGFGETQILVIKGKREGAFDQRQRNNNKGQGNFKLQEQDQGLGRTIERGPDIAETDVSPRSPRTSLDAEFQLCEEPQLQKIVDLSSDESDEGISENEQNTSADGKFRSNIRTGTEARFSKSDTTFTKPDPAKSKLLPVSTVADPTNPLQQTTINMSGTTQSSDISALGEVALSGDYSPLSSFTPRGKAVRLDPIQRSTSQELSEVGSLTSGGLETISNALDVQSDYDSSRPNYIEPTDVKIAAGARLGYTWT